MTIRRRLATFDGRGYDKGRSWFWQAAWFACMNLVFSKWWCPTRVRVALLRYFGASIGDRVLIRHRVRILWPWKLSVGSDVWIGEDVWILNLEEVVIGDDVCVSQAAFLCTGSHNYKDPAFGYDNAPITVGDGVWVGTQATVLRGVVLGRGATVGAKSLVTRSVPAGALIAGPGARADRA